MALNHPRVFSSHFHASGILQTLLRPEPTQTAFFLFFATELNFTIFQFYYACTLRTGFHTFYCFRSFQTKGAHTFPRMHALIICVFDIKSRKFFETSRALVWRKRSSSTSLFFHLYQTDHRFRGRNSIFFCGADFHSEEFHQHTGSPQTRTAKGAHHFE